jgi:hypothetical protein
MTRKVLKVAGIATAIAAGLVLLAMVAVFVQAAVRPAHR